MPLSEKELQLIPELEKLSVSIQLSGHNNLKNQLSTTEKKKIFQIARIINLQQSKRTPKQKFRNNLEKSIENHMKRMATCTGKNIRIIKPPPAGLKVLKNGEWVIPKHEQHSFGNCVERAKQLLSQVPMTIPDIEPFSIKKSEKLKNNSKKKKVKLDALSSKMKSALPISDAEQILLFRKMFENFIKKRKEFIDCVKDLQDHLEDMRFENSATRLITKNESSFSEIDKKSTPVRRLRRKMTIKKLKQTGFSSCSCPALVRKTKPKIIIRKTSDHQL